MKIYTILLIGILMSLGCTDEDAAMRTLHSSGFSNVKITGWAPYSCGEDDFSSTGFQAFNPVGLRVEGVVCCGMFTKSCTIRF